MMLGKEPASEMTVRQAFAMAAMQGVLADENRDGTFSEYAEWAVKYADALLAELAKGGKE